MSEPTYFIYKCALVLSSVLLLCSFAYFLESGGISGNYYLYRCALELSQTPAAILLVAIIGAACVEDSQRK